MNASRRASPPPPLDLDPPSGLGDALASPESFYSPPLSHAQRTGSYSTTSTNLESFSPPRRSSSFGFIKSSPTVNVHTTCGRHTDQLLFGGPSLRGLAKALFKRTK